MPGKPHQAKHFWCRVEWICVAGPGLPELSGSTFWLIEDPALWHPNALKEHMDRGWLYETNSLKSADYTPIHCASWNRVCGEARSVSSKPNRNKSQLPCSHFECWGRWEAAKNFRHCLDLRGSNRSNKSATCQIAVPPKRTPNRLRTAAQVYLT